MRPHQNIILLCHLDDGKNERLILRSLKGLFNNEQSLSTKRNSHVPNREKTMCSTSRYRHCHCNCKYSWPQLIYGNQCGITWLRLVPTLFSSWISPSYIQISTKQNTYFIIYLTLYHNPIYYTPYVLVDGNDSWHIL